jgi:hypothetical protein
MNAGERWQRIAMQTADIQAVGEKLDVGYVVAGSMTRAGTNNVYHAWLYETKTGEVRASNSIEYKTITDGLTMARLLADWLLNDAAPLYGPATPAAAPAVVPAATPVAAPAASLSVVPQQSSSVAPAIVQAPVSSTQSWPTVNNVPTNQTVPWTAIITQPGLVVTNPVTPVSQPAAEVASAGTIAATAAAVAAPTPVIVNINPSSAAGAVPSMPLVFNNNNNNNNNNVVPGGGGSGGGGSQQQQQQQSDSSPVIINQVEQPQPTKETLLLIVPQTPEPQPQPQPQQLPALPENPPAEPIVVSTTTEIQVESRKIAYFGLRAGLNMPQYSAVGRVGEEDYDEDTIELSVVESGGMLDTMELEGALFFGVQIANWVALQVDGIYTMTSALASNAEGVSRTFSSTLDLMVAAQLKLTFRPGKLFIGVGGGAYAALYPAGFTTLPYEDGEPVEDGAISTPLFNSPIAGWTASLDVGFKLGPGELFLQGQVYGDLADTGLSVAIEEGTVADYHRRTLMPSVTIGYQIQFGTVKKVIQPETK